MKVLENVKGILQIVKVAVKKGFLYIFTGSFLSKISRFIASFVIVRILSKSDYGVWAYAQNIFQLFMLFDGLGIASGLLYYCSKARTFEEKTAIMKFGSFYGTFVNFVFSIAVVVYSFSGLIPIKEASGLLAILSFSSIPRINFSVREQYLRSLFRSREYGFVLVANSLFYMVLAITFAFFFGVMGLALVEYIVPLFGMMSIVYVLKDLRNSNLSWKDIVTKDLRKKIIDYSFVSSATNVLSQLLYLLDVFVLGYMTKNTNTIASYKVATLIPYNLTFIPLSVMVFIYPYFAKYSTDKEWVRTKYKDMLKVMILLNLNISILAIFFARWIISIFFGAKYLDAVPAFRVLMLGYLVAGTFRIPSGNVLSAIGKLRVNFWNAVISGTANILLDVVMIKLYSAIGAAYATVIVYVISSVISTGYLWRYLKKSF